MTRVEKIQPCKLYLLFGKSYILTKARYRKYLYHFGITTRTINNLIQKGYLKERCLDYCISKHWLKFQMYCQITDKVTFPEVIGSNMPIKDLKAYYKPYSLWFNQPSYWEDTIFVDEVKEFEDGILKESPFLMTAFQHEKLVHWEESFDYLLKPLVKGIK